MLARRGPRPGCLTGAVDLVDSETADVAEHLAEILIHREVHETGSIPIAEYICPGDQATVVVAALCGLARLQMVVGRIAERRQALPHLHVGDPVLGLGFCPRNREECVHLLHGWPAGETAGSLQRGVRP